MFVKHYTLDEQLEYRKRKRSQFNTYEELEIETLMRHYIIMWQQIRNVDLVEHIAAYESMLNTLQVIKDMCFVHQGCSPLMFIGSSLKAVGDDPQEYDHEEQINSVKTMLIILKQATIKRTSLYSPRSTWYDFDNLGDTLDEMLAIEDALREIYGRKDKQA